MVKLLPGDDSTSPQSCTIGNKTHSIPTAVASRSKPPVFYIVVVPYECLCSFVSALEIFEIIGILTIIFSNYICKAMFGFGNLFVVWNLLFTERPSKHFDTTQDVVTDGRQLPVCSECVPREFIVAPGVGIDLTSTYGYAFSPLTKYLI